MRCDQRQDLGNIVGGELAYVRPLDLSVVINEHNLRHK